MNIENELHSTTDSLEINPWEAVVDPSYGYLQRFGPAVSRLILIAATLSSCTIQRQSGPESIGGVGSSIPQQPGIVYDFQFEGSQRRVYAEIHTGSDRIRLDAKFGPGMYGLFGSGFGHTGGWGYYDSGEPSAIKTIFYLK